LQDDAASENILQNSSWTTRMWTANHWIPRPFRGLFVAFLSVLMIAASPQITSASVPSPRLKPAPPALSAYLTESDARLLRQGLAASKAGRWSEVTAVRLKMNDPVAKDLLRWTRAARDRNAPLSDLEYVHQRLGDWPRMTAVRAEAERRMFDDRWPAQKVLDWFVTTEPVAGEGRAALARAHYARGNKTDGDKWLALAWRESRLTRDRQKTMFGEFKSKLTKDDHAARADHLIWLGRRHFTNANALLPHMSRNDRALMNARMKLARNASGMDSAINAVPPSLQSDPGLVYERAKWRRRKKTKNYAMPVYLSVRTPPQSDLGKTAMWREKKLMAYWAIQERDFKEAYQLTLHHGLTRGSSFAEVEFLSGWLALTQLREPDRALPHFIRLRDGVGSPISLARAHYWIGRTHEAKRDGQQNTHYRQAAQYQNTYYGMLAALELEGGTARVSLPPEFISETSKASFEADNRVRALNLLGEAGEERYFSQMAFHLDDELKELDQLSLLAKLSSEYGFMRPSVRAAKQAGRFQSMLTESGYPIVGAIDALPASQFEKAFVYAIARQESEFAPNAVSSAKAYGLMQMINSTAKATARKHRIKYSQTRLASDADYAAKMGALHLNDLLEMWDGSYILAAVSYNAGPHRARSWIKKYGDPRTGEIDPIDWVEKIPFSETRNYVMRVLENMNVYRARLDGNSAPNRLQEDMLRGQRG
jgi:soluble lytic murein transglycosylase